MGWGPGGGRGVLAAFGGLKKMRLRKTQHGILLSFRFSARELMKSYVCTLLSHRKGSILTRIRKKHNILLSQCSQCYQRNKGLLCVKSCNIKIYSGSLHEYSAKCSRTSKYLLYETPSIAVLCHVSLSLSLSRKSISLMAVHKTIHSKGLFIKPHQSPEVPVQTVLLGLK